MNKYKILVKQCMICGKKFPIKVRKFDKKIMSKCFHSYMNKYFFQGWCYEVIDVSKDLFNTKIKFKNNFYKIIGFCHVSRETYYFIWKLFHNQKIEYWECSKCYKE